MAGVGSPGDVRRQFRGVDDDLTVEDRVVVAAQLQPLLDGRVPLVAARGVRSPLEVVEGDVVGRDHPGSRSRFDRHVADGHPRFHRQCLDGRSAVLDDVPLTAAGADLGDDGEHEVLGGDSARQDPIHGDRHRAEGAQGQRLCRENVLDLARADTERQRAERAMGRRVAIAADDRHPRLSEAELRPDDVDDALLGIPHAMQANAELGAVATQRVDLLARNGVGDREFDADRRNVVVLGGERQVWSPYSPAGGAQAVECLWAGDLVDEVKVDVEQVGLAVDALDDVRVPDLFRQSASHRGLLALALPRSRGSLRLVSRDGSINAWTTLAESASWTRPPPS